MKGFATEAIVIYPKEETLSGASLQYQGYFKTIMYNLSKMFKNQFDMNINTIYSNVLSDYPIPNSHTVFDICKSDLTFLNRVANVPMNNTSEFEDIKVEAVKKYPVARGISDEDRFAIIDKRQRYIGEHIIKTYKVIVDFQRKNNAYYKNKPKNDQILRLYVDYGTLSVKAYLGEQEMPIVDVIRKDYAVLPLYQWRVD